MLPTTAFPAPIPFSQADAIRVISLSEALNLAGAFLTFVMIPVEERLGEWRFAGGGPTLASALERINQFACEIGLALPDSPPVLPEWLAASAIEIQTDLNQAWSYTGLPLDAIGPHQVILFGEGQAPYDDLGFCVLEIESLAGSAFENQAPETDRPAEWPDPSEADEFE